MAHELHAHTSFIHSKTHNNNKLNRKAIATLNSRNQTELHKCLLVFLRAVLLREEDKEKFWKVKNSPLALKHNNMRLPHPHGHYRNSIQLQASNRNMGHFHDTPHDLIL